MAILLSSDNPFSPSSLAESCSWPYLEIGWEGGCKGSGMEEEQEEVEEEEEEEEEGSGG